ncbi:MAG: hypothetical protein R3Y53_00400 [Bacillota bacterium]
MKIGFNSIVNASQTTASQAQTKTQNIQKESTTVQPRKSFDSMMFQQSPTAAKIDTAKSEISSEAKAPKSQDFLSTLQKEIEDGTYSVDVNALAKNMTFAGVI